jgi:alkanesulfonate monooxygenase SsuD/methylene tetrahydromethanopterin reductase-like flavin-dependent oxidoreductase (luciferase family)
VTCLTRCTARNRANLGRLITTNDPVKIAEDYSMLQHLADGRVDLMMGRGNTGPVYPWFGQDIRNGIELAVEWPGRFRGG